MLLIGAVMTLPRTGKTFSLRSYLVLLVIAAQLPLVTLSAGLVLWPRPELAGGPSHGIDWLDGSKIRYENPPPSGDDWLLAATNDYLSALRSQADAASDTQKFLSKYNAALARLNEAMGTIAKDPFAWYFSAALAIREGKPKDAERMIGEALKLAPADPMILFEAGHVAAENDDVPGARDYWTRAIERDPNGPAGNAAREALNMLPVPLTVTDRIADPAQQEPDEPDPAQPKS